MLDPSSYTPRLSSAILVMQEATPTEHLHTPSYWHFQKRSRTQRRPSRCKQWRDQRTKLRVLIYSAGNSEPENPKGYIRKCTVLFGMKEHDKAISAAQEATEKDVNKKNTAEIQRELQKAVNAKYSERSGETDEQTAQRAMRDPEVQKILQDPVMMQILQQAQENPQSLQEHLKNPSIREKIMKLSQSGILKMR